MNNSGYNPPFRWLVYLPQDTHIDRILYEVNRHGGEMQWVALGPHAEYPGEYGIANGDIWEGIRNNIKEETQEEGVNLVSDPDTWDMDERRRFIQLIVAEHGYLGHNGCEMLPALRALLYVDE